MKRLLGTVALFIVVALIPLVSSGSQAEAQGSFDQDLIRLMNNHRVSIGRAPLVSSATLSSSSLSWSTTMRNTGNFQHATGLGSTAENIASSHGPVGQLIGISWSTAAGFLPSYCRSSMDYTTAEFMMCQWLSSSGHRSTIENASLRQVGSGTATGAGNFGRKTYSTMRFTATPAATPVTDIVVEPGHSIASNTDGDLVTVSLKSDGALWTRRNLGSGWSGWQSLGAGDWASADTAIAPNGSVHFAAIKADGRLYTLAWSTAGAFSWTDHGTGWDPETTPSISTNSSKVTLAAITANGQLRTKTRQGSWSGATVHGATGWAAVDIDIAADGDIWFAGVKTDGRLYVRKHLGTSWSGFALMGAATWSADTPPAIAARSNGVIFAAVKRDGRLYTREQSGGAWSGWARQGVASWSSVDIDMAENGHAWLAAIKTWGRLYTREHTASGAWQSWGRQGADSWSTNATPSISASSGGSPALVAVKANGLLYLRTRSGNSWVSWVKLGAGNWAPGK